MPVSSSAEFDILFVVRVLNINSESQSRIGGRADDEEFPWTARRFAEGH